MLNSTLNSTPNSTQVAPLQETGTSKEKPLFNTLSEYLKETYGGPAQKVTVEASFTCPNIDGTKGKGGCIYCLPLVNTPKTMVRGESVTTQIDKSAGYVKRRYKTERLIAYFQLNSNTYGPPEKLTKLYDEALSHPRVVGLAVSTRPDCLSDVVLEYFGGLGKDKFWLELGLQSAKDETLAYINRGHTVEEFTTAVEKCHKYGIKVCGHLIIGLPKGPPKGLPYMETRDDMLNSVKLLTELNIWGVKFHQLQVVKGTRLEELYNDGGVKLLGFDEYGEIVADSIELLPPGMIVHRLTGDTPHNMLVGPKWSDELNRKDRITKRVREILRARGSRQGAGYGAQE